ncbi:MAG: hypothetical protein RLZZ127_1927 [Planctomycetota bacterium]|jgi:hypothetical protein
MSIYHDQRAAILARHPGLAPFAPAQPPPAPAIPALGPAGLRRVLGDAAGTHGALTVVVGFGDGSVLAAIARDPHLRGKEIHQLLLAGEEDAFAAALAAPYLEALNGLRLRMAMLRRPEDIAGYAITAFAGHAEIPLLAGADFIEDHPLTGAAAANRAEWLPQLRKALADRPTSYGNDVVDSFTGLKQASLNAHILLPAPTIGQMRGLYGTTPVISIAAGPSLKRRIDQLRALQDRCILVACDAVLSGLIDAGIDPHFVTPLERIEATRRMMERAGESRAVYAGLPVVMPEVVAAFAGRAISISCGDRLYDWLDPGLPFRINSGMSTGVLSVTVAAAITRGPVYLVGHDLSREAGAASHWAGASFAGDSWSRIKTRVETRQSALSGYETRMIPGNGGGLVESIAWWDRFREEIAHEAWQVAQQGREVRNPNAADGIFAKIDHTVAAPLPDPADLPPLPPTALPQGDPGRLARWQARARLLPADCDAFTAHLGRIRDDLAAMRPLGSERWDVEALAGRLDFAAAGISEGNQAAFAYFLRSALHNTNATMHLHRRVRNAALARWRMLDAIDQACQAMANAVATLRPEIEEIVRERC